jgi:hypothetical protein
MNGSVRCSPLLVLSGHSGAANQCPLLRVKQTLRLSYSQRDKARRIAANIAKRPDLIRKDIALPVAREAEEDWRNN